MIEAMTNEWGLLQNHPPLPWYRYFHFKCAIVLLVIGLFYTFDYMGIKEVLLGSIIGITIEKVTTIGISI